MTHPANLVEHAKRELEYAGVEKDIADKIVDMVRIFSDMGHSGMSASYVGGIVKDLLQRKNLIALTDDPDEWVHYGEEKWGEKGGIWQNTRNPEAFSRDGGKTYYLLSDATSKDGFKSKNSSSPAVIKKTNKS